MVAVESSAENEFIKRVVDVEESDMPNSNDYWVLGGKRDGVGQPYQWVQTGNSVGFTDWASGRPPHPTTPKLYIYMTRRGDRRWGAYTGTEQNIICEG